MYMLAQTRGWRIFFATAFTGIGVSGCASMNYIMQAYDGVPVQQVATQYDTFRVFDKPAEGRMMITSSLASAAAQGFAGGLLLNPTVTATPKPVFEEAAQAYLKQTGRNCKITDGYLLVNPQWEFKYSCEIATSSISKN
ncbi:MAG: hypothetical protein JSR99_08245 [Proteobacteria bacterium]|nr:hypothetical protein [Pseudomonadota bacterium]